MMLLRIPIKWLTILLAILFLGMQTPEVMSAELKPKTVEAFDRYVRLTEARINWEVSQTEKFLYLDELPPPRRAEVLAALKRGEIFMERLQTLDASGQKMEAPEAIIHHWLGAVFVPGASLPQTMALVQDYNHHQDIYKPEVVGSRLIGHTGNDFQIYYRLGKRKSSPSRSTPSTTFIILQSIRRAATAALIQPKSPKWPMPTHRMSAKSPLARTEDSSGESIPIGSLRRKTAASTSSASQFPSPAIFPQDWAG